MSSRSGAKLKADTADLRFDPSKPVATGRQMVDALFGLWADRTDIKNSAQYARRLRRAVEKRKK